MEVDLEVESWWRFQQSKEEVAAVSSLLAILYGMLRARLRVQELAEVVEMTCSKSKRVFATSDSVPIYFFVSPRA